MAELKNFLEQCPLWPPMTRTISFSLLLMLISAWTASGATYYVKAGGNDRLDGLSDVTAWATIARVNRTVVSGDTVYFRSQDTWSGILPVLTAKGGVTYDGSTYGSGKRARFVATGGQVVPHFSVVNIYESNITLKGFEIDGNRKVTGGIYIGYGATADMSGTVVDNCVVHDTGDPNKSQWLYGIHVGSTQGRRKISNTTITNCEVYDTGHEGIAVYAGWPTVGNKNDTVLIRACNIHDTGTNGLGSGTGIAINNDSSNVTVEYCYVHNNHYGINMRVSPNWEGTGNILSAPNNVIIRYNIISYNTIYGYVVTNNRSMPTSATFYGNLFYENGQTNATHDGMDFHIFTDPGFTYLGSVFNIHNNTFYSTMNGNTNARAVVAIGYFGGGDLGGATVNFKNNIVYAGNYLPLWDAKGTLTHSNNLIYRSSSPSDIHVHSNGTNYNRAGVTTWESSAKNTDPAFAGGVLHRGVIGTYGKDPVSNADYCAITGGDAIDNGTALGSPYDGCINGAGLATPVIKPQVADYDIGVYEQREHGKVPQH